MQEQLKEEKRRHLMHTKKKSIHGYQSDEGSFEHLPEDSSESDSGKSESSLCGECPGCLRQEDCMECEVCIVSCFSKYVFWNLNCKI